MSEPTAEAPEAPILREPPESIGAARRRHLVFLVVSAVIVVAVLVAAQAVLLPFVLALVISYVLTPAVAWVERKRVPRALAIILVYVGVLGSLGLFLRLSTPRVAQELASIRRELPAIGRTIKTEWVPGVQRQLREWGLGGTPPEEGRPHERDAEEDTPELVARQRPDGSYAIEWTGPLAITPTKDGGYTVEALKEPKHERFDLDKAVAELAGKSVAYAQHNTIEVVKFGRDVIAGVSRFFFVFGITLMLAAYTILTRERIFGFFASLLPPRARPSWTVLLRRIDEGLSGVVRGQLVICLVNGVLSAIGFAIVGLKYWPVLALLATVFSLIPIFGSIISAVPAVLLGLTQSIGTAAFVLVWIIGIHQLEANLLNPKIMGDAAKIHPVLVIFALLVGEHFYGVVGALLAVPVMSIAQSIFLHIRRQLQLADPEMAGEVVLTVPPPPR